MNIVELIENACLSGESIPNKRRLEVREFLNKQKNEQLSIQGKCVRNSIECTINPDNGRMKIESTNEEGSIKLGKWIKDNTYCFDKRLDIDIYAH